MAFSPAFPHSASRSSCRKLLLDSLQCIPCSHPSVSARRHAQHSSISAREQALNNRSWSQEDLDNLRSLLGRGSSPYKAAKALGKTRFHVNQVCRYDSIDQGYYTPERPIDVEEFRRQQRLTNRNQSGPDDAKVQRTRRPWTQAEIDHLRELRASGMSCREAADKIGRTQKSAYAMVQQYNLARGRIKRLRTARVLPRSKTPPAIPFPTAGQSVSDVAGRPAEPTNMSFSATEDQQIIELLTEGKELQEIQGLMPDRPASIIRRRVAQLSSNVARKRFSWTTQDIATLVQMKTNRCSWAEIAAAFPPNVTAQACQRRWQRATGTPRKSTPKWTDEETRILRDLKSKSFSWAEIANALPGRSAWGCHKKWKAMELSTIDSANE